MVDKTYLIRIIKLLVVLPAIALPFLISQALVRENPGEILAGGPIDFPFMGAEQVWIAVGGVVLSRDVGTDG
jgi:hypothetical protein